ncbi:aminotransferase class I/II-fold pyridoxal phosphate-dependent enzyme [Methanonatronarchaeum sp. AMET-Sl]|uniref:pyridoxal phosphate-dependent aminotransferase n=1 Tax=Methanonatronarchaeum sp. AMET-Sl TaxID=3037654 RepID=UPI00244DD540|nr:aminotransferase class I/II-fold pyridoxal phosphate-dependent enzyme [Methanonatronarchaeum sp. AMET-Sl]WGI17001.1 aminotransferase class I/II-fold pyridoxal phosphate-dependent enzyme [Methanonatronarchaeum sp. AMET-Sl]
MKQFSDRVKRLQPSGIRDLFDQVGPETANLGIGEPDYKTPNYIKKAGKKAIDNGYTTYTPNKGLPELRNAITKYLSKYKVQTNPDQIIVTSGASEALHLAAQTYINNGDEVLIPDPGFVSYRPLTIIAGGNPKPLPLKPEDEFKINPEIFKEKITPNTTVLFLNSPSNPTGAINNPKETKAITEIAEDNNIKIISDEVYSEIIYEGKHTSPAQYNPNITTINGMSKTFAMTGWRIGYITAPKQDIDQMLKIHQYIQACAPSISQKAATTALKTDNQFIEKTVKKLREKRNLLINGLKNTEIKIKKPEGSFYAYPEISKKGTDKQVIKKLIKNNVIAVPGRTFGSQKTNQNHIRISFSTKKEDIKKFIKEIKKI